MAGGSETLGLRVRMICSPCLALVPSKRYHSAVNCLEPSNLLWSQRWFHELVIASISSLFFPTPYRRRAMISDHRFLLPCQWQHLTLRFGCRARRVVKARSKSLSGRCHSHLASITKRCFLSLWPPSGLRRALQLCDGPPTCDTPSMRGNYEQQQWRRRRRQDTQQALKQLFFTVPASAQSLRAYSMITRTPPRIV